MSSTDNMLNKKKVMIFAATGAIARATAAEAGRRRARLFLSARSEPELRAFARELSVQGVDVADIDRVDACDAVTVRTYFERIAGRGDAPDVLFNGIGVRAHEGDFGTPSSALPLSSFLLPIERIVGSQFLTASTAAPLMSRNNGTIIFLTASLAKAAIPRMAGITAACDAVEALARVLGAEYREAGLRVLCARVAAMPETRMIQETTAANARSLGISAEKYAERLRAGASTGRQLTLEDTARAIVHLMHTNAQEFSFEPVNIGLL